LFRVLDFNLTLRGQERGINGQRVGYIRVSTLEQNTDRQLDGIEVDRTFADHVSGKDLHRPQLAAMLAFVRDGDTVVVYSMDRLARNLDDLRATVRTLTARGVQVQFMKEQLTFTGEDTAMATLLLSIMGAFAEFERSLITERQREGIALAKQRGAYRGRRKALTADKVNELRAGASAGRAKAELAREFGISRETVYQYLRSPSATPVTPALAGSTGSPDRPAGPGSVPHPAPGQGGHLRGGRHGRSVQRQIQILTLGGAGQPAPGEHGRTVGIRYPQVSCPGTGERPGDLPFRGSPVLAYERNSRPLEMSGQPPQHVQFDEHRADEMFGGSALRSDGEDQMSAVRHEAVVDRADDGGVIVEIHAHRDSRARRRVSGHGRRRGCGRHCARSPRRTQCGRCAGTAGSRGR